jgi:hypothetical protein
MVEPILSVLLDYPVSGGFDGAIQCLSGTGLGRTQPNFKVAEGLPNALSAFFDGVKVRHRVAAIAGVRCAPPPVRPKQSLCGQVIEHHDVAGL